MTIFALSSGPGISGVAVIRISGSKTKDVIKKITTRSLPEPRVATLRKVMSNLINGAGLVLRPDAR